MARSFLIDTDTASDDAVALIMALRHPDADVKAITTVAGNVPVPQGTRNALLVTELCGADVPVYRGADKPLLRAYRDAEFFHGQDGLGDQGYPDPQRQPADGHAVPALIETIRAHPGIVVVTLGPLTNLALAVMQAPDIVANVSRCVVMGGAACTFGNVTPAAEYNVWCDPEAARIVFQSGLPVEMVGWELSIGEYALTMDEVAATRAIGTELARFAMDCNSTALDAFYKQTGQRGMGLPDPVAMAVALMPDIVTERSDHYVEVVTGDGVTRGMTVVDRLNVADTAHARAAWTEVLARGHRIGVVWSLDAARWKRLLRDLLA